MTRQLFCFLVAVFTFAGLAPAQSGDESYNRIARLSYIEGNVSFQHESDVDWSAASINLPLEPGDRIYTGPEGRAEIEFDDRSVCRLDRNTDIEFLSLKENLVQIRILLGVSTLTVSSGLEFEINTPAAAFNTVEPGVYRFSVVESGDTDAIARKGELEAANSSFSRRVDTGEILRATPGDYRRPEISEYNGRDEWDQWNDRRNADMKSYASGGYLPDNVYMGASELNRYGRWVDVDSYGMAWEPYSVDEDWSPYSVGRWCYRPLWGWTWISYEPWGWLPYHYGRWYYSPHHRWCWLPGPSFAFNFWSPGLVTFYSGPGWVSWIPLGPGDYYDFNRYYFNRRVYGYQLAQLRTLQTRAPGDPFNRYARGAFRTAEIDQFRNGSFETGRNSRWAPIDRPWTRGTLVMDRLNIQPTVTSYSARPGRAAFSPRWNTTLPAVVRTNPAVTERSGRQFSRVINPQIPSSPAKSWINRTDQRPPDSGSSRSNAGRSYQTPQPAGRGQQTEGAPARNREYSPERSSNSSRWIYRGNEQQSRQAPPAAAPAKPDNFAPPAQQRNNSETSRSFGNLGNPGVRPAQQEHNQIYNPPRQLNNMVRPSPAPARSEAPRGGGPSGRWGGAARGNQNGAASGTGPSR
jgi:hypothetical protein